ncbi:MAG: hypothetical protein P4L77_03685 [Sulfuriferula sp.]|nr:hypothetical protein [Sulfuriferula sp.]
MGVSTTGLESRQLCFDEWMRQSGVLNSRALGSLCYSSAPLPLADCDIPGIHVAMTVLAAVNISAAMSTQPDAVCELWSSSVQTVAGQYGEIRYRHDGNTLFGVIQLDESADDAVQSSALQCSTERAYRQIFELLDKLGYPYVYRFWNYMADINRDSDGLERYRQFNLGRQDAFIASARNVAGNVPAACALGAAGGPLTVAFLAGHVQPLAIENPRQLSAYEYPQDYGPRSPTFSRASLVRSGAEDMLFVSGTASIVGHVTMHAADVAAQTRETLANIAAIIQAANERIGQLRFSPDQLFYRVYVRHAADLEIVRAVMQTQIGASLQAVFLQADVCRQDLLMEIEAGASQPAA